MNLRSFYNLLSPLMRPISLPYSLLMQQRRKMYTEGTLQSFSPSCPCVSIGNIAWGGTGKTPFTAWFLEWARHNHVRTTVLTRGYGGTPGSQPLLVKKDTPAHLSGDEPLLLARKFPEVSVLAFPKRKESAAYAEKNLQPQLFLLDDGMQHLAVQRDIDIVLLRIEDFEEEWNHVIPSGAWRENATALDAATVFAVKADAETFNRLAPQAEERLGNMGKPLFSFTLEPTGIRPLFPQYSHKDEPEESLIFGSPCELNGCPADPRAASLHDAPYLLISGVGDPDQVEQSARKFMGRSPLQHFAFDDHHPYSEADVQAVIKLAAAPLPVLCTGKDAVKLQKFAELWGPIPVWVLETTLQFGPALFTKTTFPAWWDTWWQQHPTTGNLHG